MERGVIAVYPKKEDMLHLLESEPVATLPTEREVDFCKCRRVVQTSELGRNKSSNQRLSLNRSQCGGCSTEYNTLTSSQVVCK